MRITRDIQDTLLPDGTCIYFVSQMSELARNLECSENTAYEYLLRRSPFEMKVCVYMVLRGSYQQVQRPKVHQRWGSGNG
jgi:hypothetical protein